jgi:hypothetical protein
MLSPPTALRVGPAPLTLVSLRVRSNFRTPDTWAWHLDNGDARGRRPFARVTLTCR